ncbi:MAG: anti-sigma factor [Acidimicrobiales bacterium]|nr:anti-sigma factor [Acidimicrobiales bacterium]
MSDNRPHDPIESDLSDLGLPGLLDSVKAQIGPEATLLDQPPPDVWAGIEAALSTEPDLSHDNDQLASSPNSVTSLDHHRRNRRPAGILLVAVAASVIAALAIGGIFSDDSRIVGEIDLAALTGNDSLGTAKIVEQAGVTRLDISFEGELAASDASYELWVIDPEIENMHSLGTITSSGAGDSGSFELPSGVDIADFPIVDISLEPDDGNPAHSGDSHFRGVLGI